MGGQRKDGGGSLGPETGSPAGTRGGSGLPAITEGSTQEQLSVYGYVFCDLYSNTLILLKMK